MFVSHNRKIKTRINIAGRNDCSVFEIETKIKLGKDQRMRLLSGMEKNFAELIFMVYVCSVFPSRLAIRLPHRFCL
ncbi:hypothetical protein DDZ16_12280 [Marinilabilia rubra]|uniref:Uncharacterized protein n=1 Tax=Marinilabilia rubra TaxID=2162893 RepID=A0A2U2B7L0_9BACT|nr:hypothetical protein DDZ16_12280 [Marinilabilia rubra]